ncbi:MAG: NAD(P)/FAD-dependent oxidoreductase [Desulfurococcaceae archaeon]
MSKDEIYDVIVVGAGVAGLYASYQLASMGWKVALVESKPASKIGDRVCGDAIGIHHFEELSLQVPSYVIDHRYKGVKIYSPSCKYNIVVPGEGVSINRLKFGQWLLSQALSKNVELFDQHVVLDVMLKDNNVTGIKVKRVNGETHIIKAKAFIDASGYKPAIRSKLPREWPISEKPYTTDYNIAYREVLKLDEPLEEVEYAEIYINVDIAPGGYWWLFPKSSSGEIINVGLGVINTGQYNPRVQYDKYLRNKFKGKVLNSGGGIVPTRRPLPTLVWRNVAVVGDAAYTVNPVHGGGIGSSLLSSHIVSKYMNSALEAGQVNEQTMWQANFDYMNAYGGKQASLDVLRMYMQKLSNDDYEWMMENKVVDGSSIYDLGVKGDLAEKITLAISLLIKLLGRPSLLNELRTVRNYMNKMRELYTTRYPSKPEELPAWMRTIDQLLLEYTYKIGFNRGNLVKW